jgi:hypothetical protein
MASTKIRLAKLEKVLAPKIIDKNSIIIIGWTNADFGPLTPEEIEEVRRSGNPVIFRGEIKEWL